MCDSCVRRYGCFTATIVPPGDDHFLCSDYVRDPDPLDDDPYWSMFGYPDEYEYLTPDELAELA